LASAPGAQAFFAGRQKTCSERSKGVSARLVQRRARICEPHIAALLVRAERAVRAAFAWHASREWECWPRTRSGCF